MAIFFGCGFAFYMGWKKICGIGGLLFAET
jgi:hypothetical protein